MGRPPKVRPPPRAGRASGGALELLQAEDLAGLSKSRWLIYLAGTDFAAAARELNKAFEWFALFATGQCNRASHSAIRDSFCQLDDLATGLLHALGHDRPHLAPQGFQDVLAHLIITMPHPDRGPPERHAQHRMETLARRAMPEAYAQREREGVSNPGWEIANLCLKDRLKATLELLQLLAPRGAEHHGALVKKGGRERKEARKQLMVILAGQYERLFGKLPKVLSGTPTKAERAAGELRPSLPKGPAMAWFRALLSLIGTRAAEALPHSQAGGTAPDPDREAMLRELVKLNAAASEGNADGLAHWIREAVLIRAKHPPPVESDDPGFTPPPLEELFR